MPPLPGLGSGLQELGLGEIDEGGRGRKCTFFKRVTVSEGTRRLIVIHIHGETNSEEGWTDSSEWLISEHSGERCTRRSIVYWVMKKCSRIG